ncbi:MAG: SRPBCC family protein [Saprospiraceae bacterium]
MNSTDKTVLTVTATINVPIEIVWTLWNTPEHIMQWNNASEDWHTTAATNDLKVGGKFNYTMAARDGSVAFDFWGVYDEVITNQKIAYTMGDGRKAEVHFSSHGDETKVLTSFEAETENSIELQQGGWQAILNNFKSYAEAYQG